MNIKIVSYIDQSYLEAASSTTDSAPADQAAAAGSSFEEVLEEAEDAIDEKAQNLMDIDAAIAEAKLSGANGLSVYSARAQELGVGSYASTSSTASTTSSYSCAYSSYTGISASAYTGILECSDVLNGYFDEAAETYQVDVKLLKSIAKAESNFSASAVSSAGAVGIMQLMPSTAAGLGVSDSYDAYENIMGGAKYIAQLLDKYDGDTSLALAAYNAGSSKVDQYGGIPPYTETENYVEKVLQYYSS